MDNAEMYFLAESSPLKLWDKFYQKQGSKWVKSFKPSVSPIEIPLFSSKDDKVKALIEAEIEKKKERARNLEKHQH